MFERHQQRRRRGVHDRQSFGFHDHHGHGPHGRGPVKPTAGTLAPAQVGAIIQAMNAAVVVVEQA